MRVERALLRAKRALLRAKRALLRVNGALLRVKRALLRVRGLVIVDSFEAGVMNATALRTNHQLLRNTACHVIVDRRYVLR